jgi:predicted DNA-binding transcriptional regulator AlpA
MNVDKKACEPVTVRDAVATERGSEKLLIDIRELSAITGIKIGTLYHWVSESRVPHIKLSQRCVRFSVPAIRQWLAELSRPAESTNPIRIKNK